MSIDPTTAAARRPERVRRLDHVVVIVDDLDDGAARLEEIGFHVTARSDHPFGTSNRLVMLTDSYIELIAVTQPGAVPDSGFARFVSDSAAAGRLGPRLVVFRSDDPEADRAQLPVGSELLRFGRDARLPDGTEARVEFVTVMPGFGDAPVVTFLCHHLTPETIWHPSLLHHPNGARRLARAVLPDPGPAGWDRIIAMASADTGPPVVVANSTLDEGSPRLVVEGSVAAAVTLSDTTVEVVPP